ncbi:DNA replication and repair protein RecF [Companilactobacillus sp. RD055328]|uniref:DNA replication/repair protein RecF n=1 Tax=Companilactobacillus sp. RD055328 TaxID=2916634 RepID=UPI001FC7EEFA|nr:DNA replication/repair protein RecF [Companilactobacillus sp. RD055328]GKQ43406.1 DNA replication and repair protein RecF [Companilactobacillus sp. RD055328]
MFIQSVALHNFRNYESLLVEFSPNVNVFIGKNAQGKTNLLEAFFVLALARSHRTTDDKDLIRWDQDFAKINAKVVKELGNEKLELVVSKAGKRARINKLEQKKLSNYVGNLNIVLFAPEDLNLIKGNPTQRRRFLDMEIGQISRSYLANFSQFKKILRQRNNYLKQLQKRKTDDKIYLDVLTEQLAKLGTEIIVERQSFLKKLEAYMQKVHIGLTNNEEALRITYLTTSFDDSLTEKNDIYENLKANYQQNYDKEIRAGTTLFGPQRDDIAFLINNHNVADFGSQGQQRTVVLSIKLAEVELIKGVIGDYPVLLLDDVLSELDEIRQTKLLKAIEDNIQTFITTTSIEGINREIVKNPKIYNVENGQIVKKLEEGR